jgi:Peptidase A4 family
MTSTQLAGGITVRTFAPPPLDFDPLKADDRELLAHGFPRRPADPDLRERWEQLASRRPHLVQPRFRQLERRDRLAKRSADRRAITAADGTTHAVDSTQNWAGALLDAPAGDRFTWIEGTFTVPDVYPPVRPEAGETYSASTWVGIDGLDGSNDVLQIGVDSLALYEFNAVVRSHLVWWEWFPGATFEITNLPVSVGDTVNGLICVDADSTTSASVSLYNLTSNMAASFRATAPDGFSSLGNTAQWIVEGLASETGSHVTSLGRFGDVYFDEANAGTAGRQLLRGGTGNVVEMTALGVVIATGVLCTPTLVQVKYTGPNF